MENKEPIVFHIKKGGNVKNMIKIMNQLKFAKRKVVFTSDVKPSIGAIIKNGNRNTNI